FLLSAIWLIRPANKKRQRWSRDAAFFAELLSSQLGEKKSTTADAKKKSRGCGLLVAPGASCQLIRHG
ncbi:hypothetical protein ACV357_35090, partial [Pseudomonas aeruginosa]